MPIVVDSYAELVSYVAQLSYFNPEYCLFFRGQTDDYTNKNQNSTSFPSLYRNLGNVAKRKGEMNRRCKRLEEAVTLLKSSFVSQKITNKKRIFQYQEVVWAILQHYEVVPTPLLDLTHSLRVASSFALQNKGEEGFLFIYALPYPRGSISYYPEHEIIIIRLLSICPPEALRPYFQEGYLVGSYPHRVGFGYNSNVDVANRMIAKFILRPQFWNKGFKPIPFSALFPKNDKIEELCESVIKKL